MVIVIFGIYLCVCVFVYALWVRVSCCRLFLVRIRLIVTFVKWYLWPKCNSSCICRSPILYLFMCGIFIATKAICQRYQRIESEWHRHTVSRHYQPNINSTNNFKSICVESVLWFRTFKHCSAGEMCAVLAQAGYNPIRNVWNTWESV